MKSKRKTGLAILMAGVILLLVGLLLLFNTNSAWALIITGASILVNTAGLTLVMWRDRREDDD